jgi:hypothetical protein
VRSRADEVEVLPIDDRVAAASAKDEVTAEAD